MPRRAARLALLATCLTILISMRPSAQCHALLLGNFIGCNSFGCRISALESDVAQLKQQVARLDPSGQIQGMGGNFQRPGMQPFNQNMNGMNSNQQLQPQPQPQQQMNNQQQANGGQGGNQPNQRQADDNRVNYALDYPGMNGQTLRRNPNYPGGLNGNPNQFINM